MIRKLTQQIILLPKYQQSLSNNIKILRSQSLRINKINKINYAIFNTKNIFFSSTSLLFTKNYYNYSSRSQVTIDYNKDYYQILKIKQTSQLSQIKKSFYNLAKQLHPDLNKGNEDKFKQINQAYNVLSHQDRRKQYDLGRVKKTTQQQQQSQQTKQQSNQHENKYKYTQNAQPYYHHSRTQWHQYRAGHLYQKNSQQMYYENLTNNLSSQKLYQNLKRNKAQKLSIKSKIEQDQQKYFNYMNKIKQKQLKDKLQYEEKIQKQKQQKIEKRKQMLSKTILGRAIINLTHKYNEFKHKLTTIFNNKNKQY